MQNDWTEKIHCGDALAMLSQMPDKMVQCIVTSPPYYGLRDYGHDGQIGLERSPDEYVANLVSKFREARRVLKDDGVLWLNLGDSYAADKGGTTPPAQTVAGGVNGKGGEAERRGQKDGYNASRNCRAYGMKNKDLIGIPWMVAFALRSDGWYLRQEIIWHKPNPMPESVKDRCVKSHEQIFLLSKSERYYFDYKAIQQPVKADWGTRNRGAGKYHNDGSGLQPHSGLEKSYDMANKRSVWTVPTEPYKYAHFAVFPPNLIRPCILAGSREGDVVMDPFAGSGTTWQVCLQHNRNFVGIELNPKYIDLAEERVRPYRNSLFKI